MANLRKCPVCGQPLPEPAHFYPFCSKRCHLLDLGKWLGEEYRVGSRADEFSLNEIDELESEHKSKLDAEDE